jgi:hypothetical protein
MHMFDQEQRFLLKGISEVAVKVHLIEDADIFSLQDKYKLIQLKRVMKALLHDAAQQTLQFEGYKQFCWRSAVHEAMTPRTPAGQRGFVVVYGLEAKDTKPLSVQEQLTLSFGGSDGRED